MSSATDVSDICEDQFCLKLFESNWDYCVWYV